VCVWGGGGFRDRVAGNRRVFRQGLPLRGLGSLRTVVRKRKHHMLGHPLHRQR